MVKSLAEIRAKLAAQENRQGGNAGGGDNAVYPHWNIAENASARIRFLPDGNEANDYFWLEQNKINLTFAGIKGQPDSKPVTVQVPCVEQWGGACPILAEVRTWFKDPSLEEMGRKYWKKKSYLAQGFVRENPMSDDKTPENPIRRFILSPQIYTLVKASVLDPEMEYFATDYEHGVDFTVRKTKAASGYADYNTSGWSRKESPLTVAELEAVEKFGLFNLSDFLGKKPGDTELKVIKEMFEASVDGQAYDPDRWSAYYRPKGVSAPSGTTATSDEPAPKAVSKPALKVVPQATVVEDDEIPFDSAASEDEGVTEASTPVDTDAGKNRRAEEILAMIRSRPKTA